jgi:hypothetical protein
MPTISIKEDPQVFLVIWGIQNLFVAIVYEFAVFEGFSEQMIVAAVPFPGPLQHFNYE